LKAESITVDSEYEPDRATPGGLSRLGHVYMPLEGLIDIEKEQDRLNRQIAKVGEQLDKVTRKLDNIDFVNRAPATVVEHEKGRKKDLLEEHEKLQQLIDMLSDSSS
jgi:valyl-tRNA synthetase